jgi:hypothetical protein
MNPFAKQASTKGAPFFLGKRAMFISFRTTETLSILSPLEINFLLSFHIKDKY